VSEPITTGCRTVDELLGGGFERGTVTQVYGPPAAGKTNLALEAAASVAARGGSALYLDTEGLSVDRLERIVETRARGTDETVEDIAGRIIVTQVLDFEEQEEAVRDASEFAPKVDLVVLDSATGFYRLERTERVTHLLSLARKHDLAVVITNQVYSDPETEDERAGPLGGHTLTHWSGAVVRLERFRGGNRRATLEKHRSRAAGETARFRITASGLEGVEG